MRSKVALLKGHYVKRSFEEHTTLPGIHVNLEDATTSISVLHVPAPFHNSSFPVTVAGTVGVGLGKGVGDRAGMDHCVENSSRGVSLGDVATHRGSAGKRMHKKTKKVQARINGRVDLVGERGFTVDRYWKMSTQFLGRRRATEVCVRCALIPLPSCFCSN